MPNRQFYTLKFKSSRLKEFGYNIDFALQESKELNELVAIADNQILRSIREITKHVVDMDKVELLYLQREICHKKLNKYISKLNLVEYIDKIQKYKAKLSLVKQKDSLAYKDIYNKYHNYDESINYINMLNRIKDKLQRTLFIPDYITVVIEHPKHYAHMFEHGFIVNGKDYRRFSCAASQARKSTVVFVNTEIIDNLRDCLENGRNKDVKFAPSKFNAYFGLAGSATHIVSDPKFIVVKDFENTTSFLANFVTETDWDEDDIIEQKMIEDMPMNRTDGMGLISPTQSKRWADELGLDWIPSQWCIRQSFIKGMLCTFDIHEFCEEINDGNYIIDTIYTDENGDYIKADLREYDVILTESQFKLWDSYKNLDEYIDNCNKNNLHWGVSLYSPKEAKDILKLNYQFIQTLNLNQHDIENLCKLFVDWICGVSYDNVPYMLLFLLGVNNNEDKIVNFLRNGDNYWIKSLIVNPELRHDKYIRTKIRELIKKKIQNGCIGDVYVRGNFQVLVYDPYGFMQHVCRQEVTGLLKQGEFYSNYWNQLDVKQVDGMRSPLTYRSEHVILDLVKNEKTEKWYKYCGHGIIINYHGHEVVNWAGADVDFDILATTNNPEIIKGVYRDELPVVYDPPKPNKIVFQEADLYNADVFSFGSIIGSITNKSSNAYALLNNLEEEYGINSEEYRLTLSRLKQCCKAQSAQIDKAKIGRKVKGIPSIWVNKQNIDIDEETGEIIDSDEEISHKELSNKVLLNRHPYFFKYRYRDTKKKYDKYIDECEVACKQKFKISLKTLQNYQKQTPSQQEFLKNFYKYMPVTYSNSPMNLLCKYIEKINFNISENIKSSDLGTIYELYKNHNVQYTKEQFDSVADVMNVYMSGKRIDNLFVDELDDEDDNLISRAKKLKTNNHGLRERLKPICSNPYMITNCLVDYFYRDNPNKNKDVLWVTYGRYIFNNIKNNTNQIAMFPYPCPNGDIYYMGKNYKLSEVDLI